MRTASECVESFPFWDEVTASKLSATVCTNLFDEPKIPWSVIDEVAATTADFLNINSSL